VGKAEKSISIVLRNLWRSARQTIILSSGWFVETGAYETSVLYMSGSQCLDRPPTFRAGMAATFTHDPESKKRVEFAIEQE
jgi:hypothetical protein